MEFQILPHDYKKCFLLAHCQTWCRCPIDVQSWFTVSRHALLIDSPIKIFNLFNFFKVVNLETINKLCPLYFSEKPEKSLSHVTMIKLHLKKCKNHFCVTTSPLTTLWWNATEMSVFISLMLSHQVVDSRFTWYTSKLKRKIKIYTPKIVLHFPKKVLLSFRMDADLAYLTTFDFFPKKFLILDHSPRPTLK